MSTINGKVCVVDGVAVDKVFSGGKQVYGRNLVIGTSNQVVQANSWNMQVADIKYDKSLGETLCASVMINNADHASNLFQGSASIRIQTFDQSGNVLATVNGNDVSYNANGLSWCSVNITDNTTSVKVVIFTNNMLNNAFYSCLKLEKGSVATDWTPAPEDVLKGDITAPNNLVESQSYLK